MGSRRDIDRLRTELEELFDEVWRTPRFSPRHCFRPSVDSFRTVDPPEYVVVIELAGVDPDQVNVVAADRSLRISGERRRAHAGKGGHIFQQMEINHGRFERHLPLPEDIDPDGGRATYERGLLTIVFPIAPRAPRQARVPIEIRRER